MCHWRYKEITKKCAATTKKRTFGKMCRNKEIFFLNALHRENDRYVLF